MTINGTNNGDDFDAEFEDADAEGGISPELASTDFGRVSDDELEDAAFQETRDNNPGLQLILLPEGATRSDAIAALSKAIPQNGYGLPAFFYRSDLLPADLHSLTQQEADVAAVYLSYDEGYPTYNDKIFWYQLPHEPFDAFQLFQRYLDQAEDLGLRQLEALAQANSISLQKIRQWRTEYYWAERSRAYDLFNIAAERKRREVRARKAENAHFQLADRLLEPLKAKFDDPEFFNTLTPKEAVEVLRLLINIQRVSLGLAQNGNAGKQEYNPEGAASGAMLMKNIVEAAGQANESIGLDNNLQALLADPNFALEAQKLVIRVRRADVSDADLDSKGAVRAIQHDA